MMHSYPRQIGVRINPGKIGIVKPVQMAVKFVSIR